MADSHVISGLRAKRDEIHRAIRDYQKSIESARKDLASINQALAIFDESNGNPRRRLKRNSVFERKELSRLLMDRIREATEPLTTERLTVAAMNAKGFNLEDARLKKRIARSISTTMNAFRNNGLVVSDGFDGKVRVWRRAA